MEAETLPKIMVTDKDQNQALIEIEPLEPGFGYTIGNSLRRVMLSSLHGSAVTEVNIEGVTHEFTSIPHVKEDALEIVLNIKELKIKNLSSEPQKIELDVKTAGKVTANDIKTNPNVEVINTDAYLATLDKGGKLKMVMTVENGRGFLPTENREKTENFGAIAIDAAFTPIELVNYRVENTRVGQMTDYDKLILNVKTNGLKSPKEAIDESINILINQFEMLAGKKVEAKEAETEEVGEEIAEEPKKAIAGSPEVNSKTKVTELDLTSRTVNALLNSGIKTFGGLRRLSDLKLSEVKGLGSKGFDEIKAILS